MYTFLRSLGMAIGVAVGGSIFQNIMKIKLLQLGLPVDIAVNAEEYALLIKEVLLSGTAGAKFTAAQIAEATAVREAFVFGFQGTFGFLTALAGLAGLASLCIRHWDLDLQSHDSQEGERGHVARSVDIEEGVMESSCSAADGEAVVIVQG